MKFSVNTREMNEAISVVTKAMPVHSSLPILDGIYIYAGVNTLFMKCSDLSLQIETEIPAIVEEEGCAVLPGKLCADLMRRFTGDTIEFETEKNSLKLRSGRVKSSLQIIPAEEYPEMVRVKDEFSAEISQSVLKSMIRQTIFSVSMDESKPILGGICLKFTSDKKLTMVALDGFRLAMRNEKISNCTGEKSVIIPYRPLTEISNILSSDDENIKLVFSSTHIKLEIGTTKLISRLLDGEYVNYSGILPKAFTSKISISVDELRDSAERALLMARESKSNMIRFNFEGDTVNITANSEKGSINDEIEINLIGKGLEIAFNAKYILDVMKVLEDETVYLNMNTSVTPCVITPIEGDKFYYMILPVRLFNS